MSKDTMQQLSEKALRILVVESIENHAVIRQSHAYHLSSIQVIVEHERLSVKSLHNYNLSIDAISTSEHKVHSVLCLSHDRVLAHALSLEKCREILYSSYLLCDECSDQKEREQAQHLIDHLKRLSAVVSVESTQGASK